MKMKVAVQFFFTIGLLFFLGSNTLHAQNNASNLKASVERGKALYLVQCLACHQVDGGGVPHLNPPLDGSEAVKGNNKSRLIKIVLNGLKGEEIEGENYSNVMAPHKELTDKQIADILTFVRNNWSNKATSVSVAEVKAVRASNK